MAEESKNTEWMKSIKNRARLARQWQGAWQAHQELAEKFRYVRIQGDGFSAISISRENPCGRLIGKGGKQIPALHQTTGEAVQSAMEALPFDDPHDYRPGAGKSEKREHRIQAFLIRHALMNKKAMHGVFAGFGDVFDELWFVTDELPAGKHRADVIALARKGEKYFPLFIELKAKRLLTELVRQLVGIRQAMKLVESDFIEYLAEASGIPPEKISFGDNRLMLIWPAPESQEERPEVEIFRRDQNGITAVYEEDVENERFHFTHWPKK